MKLENLQLDGQRVLMRVDFNVPLNADNQVTDASRIEAALPTIRFILSKGGKLILMSHLGRPLKKLNADGTINRPKFTLLNTVDTLSNLLGQTVHFVEDCMGEKAERAVANLNKGELLILENTRFYKEEEKGDPNFAKAIAYLGDIYINDAFGAAHREHASTATIAQYFDEAHKAFGFLMRSELESAARLIHNPQAPYVAIIGGAKVSDKILLLEKLLDYVDLLLIGGGMAYTLLKAQGASIGNSLVEDDKLDLALELLAKAKAKGVKLLLPEDSIVADKFDNAANTELVSSFDIPANWMGLDIGPKAVATFSEAILSAKSILWNGPMGVFEMSSFANGTQKIAEAVAAATANGAFSLVGGGDSVAALHQTGKADAVSYVSTGGGAMLELLQGNILPGVAAIGDLV